MVGGEAGIGSFVGIEEETTRVCLGAHISTSIQAQSERKTKWSG
jgi:hypothetical protein